MDTDEIAAVLQTAVIVGLSGDAALLGRHAASRKAMSQYAEE